MMSPASLSALAFADSSFFWFASASAASAARFVFSQSSRTLSMLWPSVCISPVSSGTGMSI